MVRTHVREGAVETLGRADRLTPGIFELDNTLHAERGFGRAGEVPPFEFARSD